MRSKRVTFTSCRETLFIFARPQVCSFCLGDQSIEAASQWESSRSGSSSSSSSLSTYSNSKSGTTSTT